MVLRKFIWVKSATFLNLPHATNAVTRITMMCIPTIAASSLEKKVIIIQFLLTIQIFQLLLPLLSLHLLSMKLRPINISGMKTKNYTGIVITLTSIETG